jgi:hypothetical protein
MRPNHHMLASPDRLVPRRTTVVLPNCPIPVADRPPSRAAQGDDSRAAAAIQLEWIGLA